MLIFCPLCGDDNLSTIYQTTELPGFQNRGYSSLDVAQQAPTGELDLVVCSFCGFVFNMAFDPTRLVYGKSYQDEQAHSEYFKIYLKKLIEFLEKRGLLNGRIVEIGCGKAYFFSKLAKTGKNILGFDPAYEGNHPGIVKDYFDERYLFGDTSTFLMRHTLEHIHDPVTFLHQIAKANKWSGRIYIEVPCFEWISKNNAFWDLCYEHCNYFTKRTLSSLFADADTGTLFGGQYIYVIGDLGKIRASATPNSVFPKHGLFRDELEKYRSFIAKERNIVVWGAGAKGVTFVNLMDPDRKRILGLIDINPKKQGRYVGKTGHKISSPDILDKVPVETVIVMNENYLDEIKRQISSDKINIWTFGSINRFMQGEVKNGNFGVG